MGLSGVTGWHHLCYRMAWAALPGGIVCVTLIVLLYGLERCYRMALTDMYVAGAAMPNGIDSVAVWT